MSLIQRIDVHPLGPTTWVYDAMPSNLAAEGIQPGDTIVTNANGVSFSVDANHNLIAVGSIGGQIRGQSFYVDTVNGSDSNTGLSWDKAFITVNKALTSIIADYASVYVVGDVREQVTVPAFNYCRLIGMSGSPRGARWRAPASPAATTPLLRLQKIGWIVSGFLFSAPTDAAAIMVERTASLNAQDSVIRGNEFNTGAIAIESNGGAPNVIVQGNRIHDMTSGSVATSGGIISTSTAQALPQRWIIGDNHLINNKNHVVMPLKIGQLKANILTDIGDSITSDVVIDLTSGDHNFVNGNYLGGAYTTVLYKPGTTDNWIGNYAPVTATTAPYGLTVAVPTA
jgi:hypothetical protein